VVISVDNGTSAHAVIGALKERGVDTVVTDHHEASPGPLPDAAAIVNPNRGDDLSGLGNLSAAGLTFMTLVAVNRELRRR
jgi:single-stranded-DNA-specific exonuclease